MIQIIKIDNYDEVAFDYIKCPVCKTRICNKPKGAKVNLLQFPKKYKGSNKMESLLLQCHKCKSKYLFSLAE